MHRRRAVFQTAFDLVAGHRTITRVKVCAALLHPFDDRSADLHGRLAKFSFDPVRPVMARTAFDRFDAGSRNELQDVASLESEILYPQVTGNVIGDFAEGTREVGTQQTGLVPYRQVFERIEYSPFDGGNVLVLGEHQRQFLLEHQHAGGNRRNDVIASRDHLEQRRYVLRLQIRDGLQIALFELRHSTAALPLRQGDFDAVVLEDARKIEPDLGVVAIAVAG